MSWHERLRRAREIDQRIGLQNIEHAAERQRHKPSPTPAAILLMEADLERLRTQRDPQAEARDPR